MLIFNPPLNSPEYKAAMKKLLGETPAPPRTEWPVDMRAVADRHWELSVMAIGWAREQAEKAMQIEAVL